MHVHAPFEELGARIKAFIAASLRSEDAHAQGSFDTEFNALALDVFALQYQHNLPYQQFCRSRGLRPSAQILAAFKSSVPEDTTTQVEHWTQIPAVPTCAFKEAEFTCLQPSERTVVFHSSGTTEQRPSRHFHNALSLALYETSLWPWFVANVLPELERSRGKGRGLKPAVLALTPAPELVPHSSLAHMFKVIQERLAEGCGDKDALFINVPLNQKKSPTPRTETAIPPHPNPSPQRRGEPAWTRAVGSGVQCASSLGGISPQPLSQGEMGARTRASSRFVGNANSDQSWALDCEAAREALDCAVRSGRPLLIVGTAFSFVHLLDWLADRGLRVALPPGSRVMETGGYKGRSRAIPKAELHQLITERLGVTSDHIICEYGMSELSSQAYSGKLGLIHPNTSKRSSVHGAESPRELAAGTAAVRSFRFPPWARARVISPETGEEVGDGQTGLLRIVDLANAFSVAALQTEDLAIRRGAGFELMGRAAQAEPRGCSLMATTIAA